MNLKKYGEAIYPDDSYEWSANDVKALERFVSDQSYTEATFPVL